MKKKQTDLKQTEKGYQKDQTAHGAVTNNMAKLEVCIGLRLKIVNTGVVQIPNLKQMGCTVRYVCAVSRQLLRLLFEMFAVLCYRPS